MNFCSHFRSQNLLGLSFYSTSTKTAFPRKSWNGSLGALYRKISKIEDPKAMPSIFPVLDKWILDGRVVDRSSLLGFIKEFRRIRRYNHALQRSPQLLCSFRTSGESRGPYAADEGYCYGKMDNLLHEIEEKGIVKNKFTYTIQISAYAVKSDVEGIHKILAEMETDPKVLDWSAYSTAASGCIKAGLVDKALLMLKKSEELVLTAEKKHCSPEHILTQYAAIGKKDEVLRLWNVTISS
ncbi:pentatricopeptide repeat-containing protein At4g21705, mitochondrial [Ziziphus jujuba]|uniref:Pentatricopeptide repeat-containing protein At4g21705, mitochondrial n=1 Tax=Ziziphus jujuba TaxID=326968 RepID=A0ABM3ZWR2_ZIZJJ|nr:pentatricopeptide repeat-containing protein At4g21705, mitochondrial [Ziziphus jujuba]